MPGTAGYAASHGRGAGFKKPRSPDGALRNPGCFTRGAVFPDFASLHPSGLRGYMAASLCGSCCRLPLSQCEPITVAHHGDVALMEGFQRRAVTDGDDGGLWQLPRQQGVLISFRGLVTRG